jgi:glucose-6-phosphate 1-dehydrogenase
VNSFYGSPRSLYVPPSHLEDIKEKIIITKQRIIKEMELPTKTLVIFGATGDLCRRKLIPALETLDKKGLLPDNFKIIGAARRENTRQSWLESLGRYYEADFSLKLDYHRCDLSDVDSLRSIPVSDDMTFFLSVPPDRYSDAIQNLKAAGLVDDPDKSRVIIEKPFGTDLESANHLQSVVAGCLREKQVYRIDHYLGKDTVNNILATRFSNTLLEPLWNRNYIEEVQIFATETIGCEGRSQYYDGAGVVRDMLQNHMLQILSLIAMDAPCRNDAKEIRREKVKVLSATRLGHKVVFGQYESYKSEEGVDAFSETPTYVAGDIYIDNWRWKGVPFHFMSGKKMPYTCTEVVIKLKAPPIGLFDGHEFNDRIVMRFQPNPHLDIRIDMKSPGLDDKVQTATLTHPYPEGAIDGYVKLFYDSLNGDQSHFVHAEEVLESWRIVDDLLCVGDKCPIRTAPFIYTGGWGPTHKTQFITKWDYPA